MIKPNYSEKIRHIRAIAALWIFVFHYYHFIAHSFFFPLESYNPLLLLIYHGYFFVYLFFVLSGYLLAKAYTQQLDIRSYSVKRIVSIFPAYYLCIAVYCLLFSSELPSLKLLVIIFSTDLGGYPEKLGHLWFINRLLECYLSFPLVWWIIQKMGQVGLIFIYLLCLLGGGYWVLNSLVTLPVFYFSFVLCFSHFILGILAAQRSVKSNLLFYAFFSVLVFVCLLVWFHQSIWQVPLSYAWTSIVWLNFIAVLFVVLIRAYLLLPFYLPCFISFVMKKMGDISYTFYLYHFLVIHFFIVHRQILSANNSLNFLVLLLISILTAITFDFVLVILIKGSLYINNMIKTGWSRLSSKT